MRVGVAVLGVAAFLAAAILTERGEAPDPTSEQLALPAGAAATGEPATYGPLPWQDAIILRTTVSPVRGTIVYFGSGGFAQVDVSKAAVDPIVQRELARGFNVVAADYKTTGAALEQLGSPQPHPVFDQVLTDASLVIGWVRTTGPGLALDTSQVIALGYSAGGGLAALIGVSANDLGLNAPDKWVSMSGVVDCRGGLTKLDRNWCNQLDAYPSLRASASTRLDRDDPPGRLIHSPDDPFVDIAAALRLRSRAAEIGVDVEFDRVDRNAFGLPFHAGHQPQLQLNAVDLDRFLDAPLPTVGLRP